METNIIYNEDCIQGLKRIPDNSVSLVVTDPPYIVENHGSGKSALTNRATNKKGDIKDIANGFDYEACFEELLRVCKVPNMFIFCSTQQVSQTMSFFEKKKLSVILLVWNKTNPSPLCNGRYVNDIEFCVYVRGKGATFNNDTPFQYKKRVYTSSICPDGNKLHPTQKPVELIKQYILQHSNEGDLVLDPFMGSATTAIACLRTNRNYIGFEINEEYWHTANERINAECQPTLFD